MISELLPWQLNIAYLSILYSMQELGKTFPLLLEKDDQFLEPLLDGMNKENLIEPSDKNNPTVWVVNKTGEALRTKMVGMYDQLLKFEVFAHVNQALELTTDQSPDGVSVYDEDLDPRFAKSSDSEDLRLAVLNWYAASAEGSLNGQTLDPYQIVFMQKLRAGEYLNKNNKRNMDFWFKLRNSDVYREIEEIVNSAVKWQELGNSVEESSNVMNALYTAGMTEQIKRDGEQCSVCQAHLGMYEYYAARDQTGTLEECSSCEASFKTEEQAVSSATETCPNCGGDILPRHRKCHGCGAKIDRSMAAGSISEETVATTVEEWGTSYYDPWGEYYVDYGYVAPYIYPGVYYDPFDAAAGLVAFGLVCAIL